jgi:hypothetical protein
MTDELTILRFSVPGTPRPQGSLKIVTSRANGQPIAVNSNTTADHRNMFVAAASAAWGARPPVTTAVELWAVYVFTRPKGHWGTGRNAEVLRASAPPEHITPPDKDKLTRLVGDALVLAGVLHDDSLIVTSHERKRYQNHLYEKPRTEIELRWVR